MANKFFKINRIASFVFLLTILIIVSNCTLKDNNKWNIENIENITYEIPNGLEIRKTDDISKDGRKYTTVWYSNKRYKMTFYYGMNLNEYKREKQYLEKIGKEGWWNEPKETIKTLGNHYATINLFEYNFTFYYKHKANDLLNNYTIITRPKYIMYSYIQVSENNKGLVVFFQCDDLNDLEVSNKILDSVKIK